MMTTCRLGRASLCPETSSSLSGVVPITSKGGFAATVQPLWLHSYYIAVFLHAVASYTLCRRVLSQSVATTTPALPFLAEGAARSHVMYKLLHVCKEGFCSVRPAVAGKYQLYAVAHRLAQALQGTYLRLETANGCIMHPAVTLNRRKTQVKDV
eukprot:658286-Prorocentrum_minimum.AAC.1